MSEEVITEETTEVVTEVIEKPPHPYADRWFYKFFSMPIFEDKTDPLRGASMSRVQTFIAFVAGLLFAVLSQAVYAVIVFRGTKIDSILYLFTSGIIGMLLGVSGYTIGSKNKKDAIVRASTAPANGPPKPPL